MLAYPVLHIVHNLEVGGGGGGANRQCVLQKGERAEGNPRKRGVRGDGGVHDAHAAADLFKICGDVEGANGRLSPEGYCRPAYNDLRRPYVVIIVVVIVNISLLPPSFPQSLPSGTQPYHSNSGVGGDGDGGTVRVVKEGLRFACPIQPSLQRWRYPVLLTHSGRLLGVAVGGGLSASPLLLLL